MNVNYKAVIKKAAEIDSSVVFSIDKQTDPGRYACALNDFIVMVYDYTCMIYPEAEYYSSDILECIHRCLKHFDPAVSSFTFYFNSSFSREFKRKKSTEKVLDLTGGISVKGDEGILLSRICRFLKEHPDIDETDIFDHLNEFASAFNVDPETLGEAIKRYKMSAKVTESVTDIDGNEASIFDTLSDSSANTEEIVIDRESFNILLANISDAYEQLRIKTRPLISAKLTNVIVESKLPFDLLDIITEANFFNKELFLQIQTRGKAFTDKELAEMHSTTGSDLTQKYTRFKELLKNRILKS